MSLRYELDKKIESYYDKKGYRKIVKNPAALTALKRAKMALDNACRAFDSGSEAATKQACEDTIRLLETAIANLKDGIKK